MTPTLGRRSLTIRLRLTFGASSISATRFRVCARSSARIERLPPEQKVTGSNPVGRIGHGGVRRYPSFARRSRDEEAVDVL